MGLKLRDLSKSAKPVFKGRRVGKNSRNKKIQRNKHVEFKI